MMVGWEYSIKQVYFAIMIKNVTQAQLLFFKLVYTIKTVRLLFAFGLLE